MWFLCDRDEFFKLEKKGKWKRSNIYYEFVVLISWYVKRFEVYSI